MTTEQRNLILQAIGALKAAIGPNMPEIPFQDQTVVREPEVADLRGRHHNTREFIRLLYAMHGTEAIEWNTRPLRQMAFDRDVKLDNFIIAAEQDGIVSVTREQHGQRQMIKNFRFIKAIK
jgi:hypothetical protein